jgi:AcrR family transcriptional regulator
MPKVSDAHLAARRRQILDAAAACFARDGFHRTSMQDIVRESGISAGLVYRYFTSKDDIIAAIVTQWHEQRRVFDEAGPGADADGRVADYLDLLRAIGRPEMAERHRLGVQIWAETVRNPRIRDLARQGVEDPRAGTAEMLRRMPAVAGLDPDAFARVLISIYQGLVLQTVWDDKINHEAYAETVAAMLAALFPAGEADG